MKVKDVFKREVVYVSPESSLLDAAKFIFGKHHKGLPVVKGSKKKLIGFITEQDILSLFFPSINDLIQDYIHERDFELMEKNVKNVLTKKVKDAMSNNIISIHIDDPILKAESLMKLKDIRRLPVVDSKGYLVGIITKSDIFNKLVSPRIRKFK
nr:CBS domain-containing protein [Candidatus Levybacteria bacterium]